MSSRSLGAGLCIQGTSLPPAPRAPYVPKCTGPPVPSPPKMTEDTEAKKSPVTSAVQYSQWLRVSCAGSIHTMFLREDEEVTTTDIFVPDMWEDEFDRTDSVVFQGQKKRCKRYGPDLAGREAFLKCCLQIAMGAGVSASQLPTDALLKSALVPRAAHVAHGLSWPDIPGFALAAWKVETFLNGPLLVEVHSFGHSRLQFRLREEASFMELYHSTEAAFFQYGCRLSDFVLCTMDGSAILPRDASLKMNQPSLRSGADDRDVKEAPNSFPSVLKLIVHDISGALVAELNMPGNSTSFECKKRLRQVTWRLEECMSLVLGDGTVWNGGPLPNTSSRGEETPLEVQLTLVWTSAFQFFAVPLNSGASIIAGKGIFRREEVPAKEDGTARVAFHISGKKPLACAGAQNLLNIQHRCDSFQRDKTPAQCGLMAQLIPGFDEDDVMTVPIKEAVRANLPKHIFEMGPELVKLRINITSDGNQVGGSHYHVLAPLEVSSCVLRNFLSYQFLPDRWTRLTVFQEKFKEVAFTNLKAYMEEERVVGFTLTHK